MEIFFPEKPIILKSILQPLLNENWKELQVKIPCGGTRLSLDYGKEKYKLSELKCHRVLEH